MRAARGAAHGTPATSPTWPRSIEAAAPVATRSRIRGCASTRSRRMTSRPIIARSPRAASAPTSSRAASGRSTVAPASRTSGSRSRAWARPRRTCGRRCGRRPTGDRSRWVALESAEEAAVLARMRARRYGRGTAAARRPVPPQPGRRARDPAGPGGGRGRSKFGMTETEVDRRLERRRRTPTAPLRPRGIHLHVGSQLGAVDAWRDAVRRGLAVVGAVARLDGRSTPSTSVAGSRSCRSTTVAEAGRFAASSRALEASRGSAADRLAIEPGRFLVARSGWLVARVLHVRERGGRQVVIDAGMTELIRPALYGARHPIVALTARGGRSRPTMSSPSNRPASRARSANRPTPSARTTCRRSVAATSSRSPTPAPTPPRCPRPTTAGRARRRSSSRPTGWLRLARRARS